MFIIGSTSLYLSALVFIDCSGVNRSSRGRRRCDDCWGLGYRFSSISCLGNRNMTSSRRRNCVRDGLQGCCSRVLWQGHSLSTTSIVGTDLREFGSVLRGLTESLAELTPAIISNARFSSSRLSSKEATSRKILSKQRQG
ncbi:hypothetical protein C8J56DRAFT_941856 [Mycena floridula]|nr:hypothetical protein C8J56DRAFT_941856 [Mycena floridula]